MLICSTCGKQEKMIAELRKKLEAQSDRILDLEKAIDQAINDIGSCFCMQPIPPFKLCFVCELEAVRSGGKR